MHAFELMGQALRRVFTPATTESLFGSGPERAESLHRRFTAKGTNPAIIVEFPLLGDPSYDVLVGAYGAALKPGTFLCEETPQVCRAAYAWAASCADQHDIDLFFELDANAGPGQHAGIHCRHRGDLPAAASFFQAIGEPWRAAPYGAIAEKLPKGWRADFAAAFLGRQGAPTRLEVVLSQEALLRIAEHPASVGEQFERLGFAAFNEPMLKGIGTIAAISRLCSLQFDILADGSLGSTVSITSCFERTGPEFSRLFRSDGDVGRICETYERMGISDERWRVAEHALFATKQLALVESELRSVKSFSLPNCGKAKWVDGTAQPAKLYLLQGVIA